MHIMMLPATLSHIFLDYFLFLELQVTNVMWHP